MRFQHPDCGIPGSGEGRSLKCRQVEEKKFLKQRGWYFSHLVRPWNTWGEVIEIYQQEKASSVQLLYLHGLRYNLEIVFCIFFNWEEE